MYRARLITRHYDNHATASIRRVKDGIPSPPGYLRARHRFNVYRKTTPTHTFDMWDCDTLEIAVDFIQRAEVPIPVVKG